MLGLRDTQAVGAAVALEVLVVLDGPRASVALVVEQYVAVALAGVQVREPLDGMGQLLALVLLLAGDLAVVPG
jgi:hypothetical protein